MFYATKQSFEGAISDNATIRAFDTEADARAWLLAGAPGEHPRVVEGTFPSAWRLFPVDNGQTEIETAIAPLALADVTIAPPGAPHGNFQAVTPTATVLTVTG